MKDSKSFSSVVCWGSACEGNFNALGWPPAKPACIEGFGAFFGHHAAANSNMPGFTQD
jgi:hypothetical protein